MTGMRNQKYDVVPLIIVKSLERDPRQSRFPESWTPLVRQDKCDHGEKNHLINEHLGIMYL